MQDSKVIRLYAIALAAVLLYGLTPLFTKIAVGTTDGVTVGALRAIVASPVAIAAIISARMSLPWRGNDKWLLIISGVGSLAVFPLLFSWGVQLTTAGHAAAGTASGAVMAGILNAWLTRRWPTLYWWLGIAVGLTGALLLIWEAVGLDVEGVTWQGDALVFAGMFAGVVGYIAGARLTRRASATAVTMWSVCVAAIVLWPVLAWQSSAAALAAIDLVYALDESERQGILDLIVAEKKKGKVSVQRFKGLGEMNPLQLRETAMAEDTRRLVQLKIEKQKDVDELLDMLLSKKRAADRKIWLEKKGDLAELV